jgi:hypothetical protein
VTSRNIICLMLQIFPNYCKVDIRSWLICLRKIRSFTPELLEFRAFCMFYCIVGRLVLDVSKNRKRDPIPVPTSIGPEEFRKFRLPGLCVVSSARRTVNETCALLGLNAALTGSLLATFRATYRTYFQESSSLRTSRQSTHKGGKAAFILQEMSPGTHFC